MSELRVGLVLSGGGAKGAYQVGVINALHELGAQIDAIAGASIGALNGAFLATSPSLEEGSQCLTKLWKILADESPLEANYPAYLKLLLAAGLTFQNPLLDRVLTGALAIIPSLNLPAGIAIKSLLSTTRMALQGRIGKEATDSGLLSTDPLHRLMDKHLDEDRLNQGIPLYVSAYRSEMISQDLLGIMKAELGLGENRLSEFFHVQALERSEQRKVLMASAAIPMLFSSQEVNGDTYTDGGQGGWCTAQGNTPIQPLLDAGYKTILVTHLSDGSLWRRQNFPDATILEIRPQRSISRSTGLFGGAKDLLGFNPASINSLMEQGYDDTMICVGKVRDALESRHQLRTSQKDLEISEKYLASSETAMRVAMRRLGSS